MDEELAEATIRQTISGMKQISSLPNVFARVNELLNDPRNSAADVGRIISGDQALTARLLKLVNSAFYGFPSKIDTVTRALTIIGFRQIRELVLATSVLNMFKGFGKDISFSIEDYWKHSLACGVACRVLAVYRQDKNPESFFVAGLLHDIGRLVLLESSPRQYDQVFKLAQSKDLLLFEAELEVFGFTHASVGKELVSLWQLPESLEKAVGGHHDPGESRYASVHADTVHVGNVLAHAMRFGASGEQFVPPLQPEAWERIGLKRSTLEPAMEKISEQFEQAVAFLLVSG